MIFPKEFNDFPEYFKELVLFLQKYSWLYEDPVTNLLTSDVFSKIPEEWILCLLNLSNEELNNIPAGLIKDDWPNSLKQFLLDCKRFTLPVLKSREPLYKASELSSLLQAVPREIWRGMSPKKKDEVEIMSEFVHQECKLLGISKILDLGSGLGYIDRLLLLRGYRILGIESQMKLIAFATVQKENFFPPCIAKNLDYRNMRICGSAISEMKNAIVTSLYKQDGDSACPAARKDNNNVNKYDWDRLLPLCNDVTVNNNSDKVCMIGLHACGDLAVTGLKFYLSLSEVSALVLIPCCYHKMSLRHGCHRQVEAEFALEEALCDTDTETGEEAFHNFPLSEALASTRSGAKFVCRPFLRLANQATNTSWQGWTEEDHQRHAFNVLSRAVVELVAQQQGATFKKCFRRVVRKTSLKGKDFLSYVEESLSRCEFVNKTQLLKFKQNKSNIRSSLLEKWEQHKDKLQLAEIMTGLQMCLEPVAESLVVADRACYLQENGATHVRVVRMIDNNLSPRCLAYVASKV